MLYVTDLSVNGNTRSHLARWVACKLRAVGDCVFVGCDEEACWRGWRVTRRGCGLARSYRDPSFDSLVYCPRCLGSGDREGEDGCRLCDGTGRLARLTEAGYRGAR